MPANPKLASNAVPSTGPVRCAAVSSTAAVTAVARSVDGVAPVTTSRW